MLILEIASSTGGRRIMSSDMPASASAARETLYGYLDPESGITYIARSRPGEAGGLPAAWGQEAAECLSRYGPAGPVRHASRRGCRC